MNSDLMALLNDERFINFMYMGDGLVGYLILSRLVFFFFFLSWSLVKLYKGYALMSDVVGDADLTVNLRFNILFSKYPVSLLCLVPTLGEPIFLFAVFDLKFIISSLYDKAVEKRKLVNKHSTLAAASGSDVGLLTVVTKDAPPDQTKDSNEDATMKASKVKA